MLNDRGATRLLAVSLALLGLGLRDNSSCSRCGLGLSLGLRMSCSRLLLCHGLRLRRLSCLRNLMGGLCLCLSLGLRLGLGLRLSLSLHHLLHARHDSRTVIRHPLAICGRLAS